MGKVKVYIVFVKVRVNGHRKLKSTRRERDLLFPWEKTGKNPSNSISCSSRSDLPMSVQMRDELRGPFHVKHTITLCFNINILFQGKKRTAIMEKCAEVEYYGCWNKRYETLTICFFYQRPWMNKKAFLSVTEATTLQYVMNAKLSKHRFWHCHESGLRRFKRYPTTYVWVSSRLPFTED